MKWIENASADTNDLLVDRWPFLPGGFDFTWSEGGAVTGCRWAVRAYIRFLVSVMKETPPPDAIAIAIFRVAT